MFSKPNRRGSKATSAASSAEVMGVDPSCDICRGWEVDGDMGFGDMPIEGGGLSRRGIDVGGGLEYRFEVSLLV